MSTEMWKGTKSMSKWAHMLSEHTLQGVRGKGRFFSCQHSGDPHYNSEWVQEDMEGWACEHSSQGENTGTGCISTFPPY